MIVAIYSDGHLLPMDVDRQATVNDDGSILITSMETLTGHVGLITHAHFLSDEFEVWAKLDEPQVISTKRAFFTAIVTLHHPRPTDDDVTLTFRTSTPVDRLEDDGGEMPSPAWLESRRRK